MSNKGKGSENNFDPASMTKSENEGMDVEVIPSLQTCARASIGFLNLKLRWNRLFFVPPPSLLTLFQFNLTFRSQGEERES